MTAYKEIKELELEGKSLLLKAKKKEISFEGEFTESHWKQNITNGLIKLLKLLIFTTYQNSMIQQLIGSFQM